MRKLLCRLMLLSAPVFFCSTSLAAEDCPEDRYRTETGSCYPVWRGETENGSYYTIVIPEGWTPDKGLVIWNHGLETYLESSDLAGALAAALLELDIESDEVVTGSVGPAPGLGDMSGIILSQGYAMAASSYLQTGWAVFDSHLANQQLYRKFLEFSARFGAGAPEPFYLAGGSMGAAVSLRDIEENLIPQPDGALLACGAVAGSENWRNAFDLRMAVEAVCLEDGAEFLPRPWYETPGRGMEAGLARTLSSCISLETRILAENRHDALQAEIDELRARKDAADSLLDELDLQRRIGVREVEQRLLLEVWELDASNRQVSNFERIQRLTPLRSAEMLTIGMFYGTYLLPRLINEPGKLNGLNPFHNVAVDYGDEQINRRIQRSVGLPAARRALTGNYTPAGAVGDTRIVSIHTSKDGIVPVENQSVLQSLVAPEKLTVGVIAESTPSHCEFRNSEVIAAWNLLQDWVEGGSQPDAEDLQDECHAVVARSEDGIFPADWDEAPDGDLHPGNRCRYAPDFSIEPELAYFPREPAPGSSGVNEYDAATGMISVGESEIPPDDDYYYILGFELFPSDPANLTFTPRAVEVLGTANDMWQHRAFVDEQFRFYLPNLNVRNDPNLAGQRFNVYMQVNDELQFEFVDFEAAGAER